MVKVAENKKSLRCIPQNLGMSEASPVCQPWTYASAHPMEDILLPKYFLSANDRLRPGDTLRAVQMSDSNIHSRINKVLEFTDMTITSVDKESIGIHVDRRVVLLETGETKEVETEVVGGDKHYGATEVTNRIEEINQFISSGVIKELQKSLADLADGVLSSKVAELKESLDEVVEAHNELQSQVNKLELAPVEQDLPLPEGKVGIVEGEEAVHRWNPGLKRHEAVIGEGDDVKVLYSNKDKQAVVKWLDSIKGQNG